MVPFERAFVTSYSPSIVTFFLYLRVSEILSLLCSITPLCPTPSLVSLKFPHVPLGLVADLWATKSEGVGLIVHAFSFQDFRTYVVMTYQRHRRTERQTDDMRSQYRALHCSASRGNSWFECTVHHAVEKNICLLTYRNTRVLDRSTSSSWSSEDGVVTYTSVFFSSSGHRCECDVTVTSLCFTLAVTTLLLQSGDVTAAVMRLYGVVIGLLFGGCSILELFVRTRALIGLAL